MHTSRWRKHSGRRIQIGHRNKWTHRVQEDRRKDLSSSARQMMVIDGWLLLCSSRAARFHRLYLPAHPYPPRGRRRQQQQLERYSEKEAHHFVDDDNINRHRLTNGKRRRIEREKEKYGREQISSLLPSKNERSLIGLYSRRRRFIRHPVVTLTVVQCHDGYR